MSYGNWAWGCIGPAIQGYVGDDWLDGEAANTEVFTKEKTRQ